MAARVERWTGRRAWWPLAWVIVCGSLVALRLYRLDGVPADIYGDIADIFDYLNQIFGLRWPVRFNYSAGPLYHYLIVPIYVLFGRSYLAIKIASVLVSLLVLASIWLLAREVSTNRWVGLLAVWIGGVSSWLLIFSRLGNSQILTPLLAGMEFVFLARYGKQGRVHNLLLATVFAGLGLYSYPQTFFLLPALAVSLLWWFLRKRVPPRHLLCAGVLALVIAVPFLLMLLHPGEVDEKYIGTKLEGLHWQAAVTTLARNTAASLLSLHVRGDRVFRSNPHRLPHLDPVTGVLLLVGIFVLVRNRSRDALWCTLWPLLFLQFPNILVLTRPLEVPSASRTLLIVPFAAVLAGLGLGWLASHIRRPMMGAAAVILVCVLIGWLNYHRYFNDYLHGLPNQNYSFARAIGEKIDAAPQDASVWIFGAYWGDKRTPERRAILYALAEPRALTFRDATGFDCTEVQSRGGPRLLILDPYNAALERAARECFPDAQFARLSAPSGKPVYAALWDYGAEPSRINESDSK
jgi:4-amino-4-deoxy-L-arabinose transferase-like glycosyltransferase